jgi:peptidoglycan/LPS O-acetylase OafA/YrhL
VLWGAGGLGVVIVLIPSLIMHSLLDIKLQYLLAQAIFFYNWTIMKNGPDGVLPGSQVLWSLSIEEQYYLGVAVCWFVIQIVSKKPLKYLALLYLIIYMYSTLAKFYISYSNEEARDATNNLSRIYFGTDCRISSIVVGGLLALWLHRDSSFRIVERYNMAMCKNIAFYLSILLFIFTLVVRESHFRDTLRFSIQEIAAVMLCYVSVRMRFPSYIDKLALSKLVQAIGKSSYSTYLVHHIFMFGLGAFFERDISTSNYIIKATIIVLSFCVGYIAHRILDQPFEKLRNRQH